MADLEVGETKQRHMGLLSGVSLVGGFVIGTGIFASPGEVFTNVNSAGISLLIWAFCGLVATCGAMSYAELGSMYPKNGADQVYLSEAFHPFLGVGYGITNIIVTMPFIEATSAAIFVSYTIKAIEAGSSTPSAPNKIVEIVAGIAMIWVVALANACHRKAGTAIQNVFTAGKVAAMIIIVILGVVFMAQGKTKDSLLMPFEGASDKPGNYVNALIFALFSFAGFNNLNAAAGELKNPRRNLPLSIVIAMASTIVLYLLINTAYFAVLDADTVRNSKAVALELGTAVVGKAGTYLTTIGVILSTIGGMNGTAIGHSRIIMAAGDENIWLPKIFGRMSRFGTPVVALLVNAVLSSLVLIIFQDFSVLGAVSCFVLMHYYGLSAAAMLYLRRKQPDAERSFKTPIIFPAFFALVAFLVNLASLITCTNYLTGIGYAVVLTFAYVISAGVYYFRVRQVKAHDLTPPVYDSEKTPTSSKSDDSK